MIALLDVNILVALAWPNHVHHAPARRWFQQESKRGWATCPLTETAFVRVSSNARAVEHAVTPGEAIELLTRLREWSGHSFLNDDVSIATSSLVAWAMVVGHQQVTDAHLLALSRRHGARLVTFDHGISNLVPAGHRASEVLQVLSGDL
ncbi:MAG: PIN domain-containing protein [Actinomycetota bacterium]|nr:PIN domain-containing protein [Actinomycetota bacterium]